MEQISSNQNPRIKKLVRLHHSRGRQQQNRIAIFGQREIFRALDSGIEPLEVFVCEQFVDTEVLVSLQEKVVSFNSKTFLVTQELFGKICFGDRSDGIVMIAERPALDVDKVFSKFCSAAPVIAVAESIEKPGNLGAILRSADGAGIDAVLLADPITDCFHPNAIRASLGTCFSVPLAVSTSEAIQQRFIADGFQVIVASLQGAKAYYDFALTSKTAIVVGNEANGVSSIWNRTEFHAAKLPMLGIADSLNVSAASAVMFYEARRQRRATD